MGEFIQHAAKTLFHGRITHLIHYLGIRHFSVFKWRYGSRASLPILTHVASRFSCSIADVPLGNKKVKNNVPKLRREIHSKLSPPAAVDFTN
ncbi:hypothetical protein AB4Y44_20400 [Paraburkholderia sp. BR10937]|uniref:hypothetical protein n=1 Tax=Paraburkholderia sp. BR10937 TaxID=3236994 RepID=UPI0034D191D1